MGVASAQGVSWGCVFKPSWLEKPSWWSIVCCPRASSIIYLFIEPCSNFQAVSRGTFLLFPNYATIHLCPEAPQLLQALAESGLSKTREGHHVGGTGKVYQPAAGWDVGVDTLTPTWLNGWSQPTGWGSGKLLYNMCSQISQFALRDSPCVASKL